MTDLYGYAGRVLRIDLTSKKITKEQLDKDLIANYIGGRGFNIHTVYTEIKPDIDALGPENKLIISNGPCAGTTVPGSSRYQISAKSPLTGFIGDSNSGGDFGATLKYAGYDMVIVEGISKKPVYIFINDDEIILKDAQHLWGKTASETRKAIEIEVNDPDVCISAIGPAGENLVKFASIICLGRLCGRTGMGAVMGSKRVKAIAVRGTRGVKIADYEKLKELNRENSSLWLNDRETFEGWTRMGPPKAWHAYAETGMFGTRNYRKGTFEKDLSKELLGENGLGKQRACISCFLGCNHTYTVKTGPYAGTVGEGFELDQLGGLGCKVGCTDIDVIMRAAAACDDYGIDLMDTTSLIAYMMECYEKGIFSSDDVDGLNLEWGNAEAILGLIEMIVYRKGIGNILAEGLKKAPQTIGKDTEKYSMNVKGMSLVMREPRASKGWALMYAVASRGACHMRAWVPEGYSAGGHVTNGIYDPQAVSLVAQYTDPLNALKEEGKAELVKYYEDLRALRDTLNICHFPLYKLGVDSKGEPGAEVYAKYINAVTGNQLDGNSALKVGERINNLERMFNIKAGLTSRDDTLPRRMLEEPLPDGPAAGEVVDLAPMVKRYYEVRGWDKEGIPTKKKLTELGL